MIAKLLLITTLAVQTPQATPAQIIDQLKQVVKQLEQLFPPPPPIDQPPPKVNITVNTVEELNTALKTADVVTVNAGNYNGNWTLTRKVVVQGGRGAIFSPVDPLLPTFYVLSNDTVIQGLTINCGTRECVVVGDLEAIEAGSQPQRVTINDNRIQADVVKGAHRGIALHGAYLSATNNDILNIVEKGRDSQGIWGNNGPGPYVIRGNHIEASGENILFGGDDPAIPGVIPSDITIAENVLRKPAWFKTYGAQNKNALELKNARRVLITANVIENEVILIQAGLVQFTPRNQDGNCNWCNVEDVVMTTNTIRSTVASGFAVNIQGTDDEHPSAQVKNITIAYNLFANATGGFQVLGGIEGGLVIDHNTLPGVKTKVFSFDDVTGHARILTPLTFTNNVAKAGTYAITGDGDPSTPFGVAVLRQFTTIRSWSGNIIEEKTNAHLWPEGQVTVAPGSFLTLLNPMTFKLVSGGAGW